MLTEPATPEMVAAWKRTWEERRGRLAPNRKSGAEVLAWLRGRYALRETRDPCALEAVRMSVLENDFLREKLPGGARPEVAAFFVEDAALIAGQEGVFRGCPIFVGIDLASGYAHVEGSAYLHDELAAFQGLDARDIENCFLVARYVDCLERCGGSV